jgi:hypothetical protein
VTARRPTRPSKLSLGSKGSYDGVSFVLRGRITLRHSSGATWNEWYASFADGRKGWVASEGGRAFVTFESDGLIPSFRTLIVGRELAPAYVVLEKGRARYASTEGRLPFEPRIGESYAYVDLEAPGGAFATLDYSEEPPRWFQGEVLPLEALFPDPRRSPRTPKRRRRA